MAISGNQRQSAERPCAAMRSCVRVKPDRQRRSVVHQGQSVAISGNQRPIRAHQQSTYLRAREADHHFNQWQSGTISGHPRTCVLERPIITSVLCKSRREQSAVLSPPAPANPSTGCVNDGCVNDERRRTAATALPLEVVLGRWTREGAKSSLIIWWKNGEWGCESARMASLIWSSSNRAGSSGLSST